jgi:hypothetical protein
MVYGTAYHECIGIPYIRKMRVQLIYYPTHGCCRTVVCTPSARAKLQLTEIYKFRIPGARLKNCHYHSVRIAVNDRAATNTYYRHN